MQPVKVKILDHEYLLKSDENVDQVYKIAEYVSDKLKEIQSHSEGLSSKKTAILVALNIASEYFQMIKDRDEERGILRRRTEALIRDINTVLE
ncbi:MAG: cell division protein ZapA [Pseudomonadota bacterium]